LQQLILQCWRTVSISTKRYDLEFTGSTKRDWDFHRKQRDSSYIW
jgi:hypothetical protein